MPTSAAPTIATDDETSQNEPPAQAGTTTRNEAMERIRGIEIDDASPEARELLEAARKKMGRVPNLLRGLAHSPAALGAYLKLSEVLAGTSLSAAQREQLALTAAGTNACEYCASAHTAIGGGLGIDAEELARNLRATSSDPATDALLRFTRAVIEKDGNVSDAELADVRAAGFDDGVLAEVVALVALNTLTNSFNRLARTEVDFPRVELPETPSSPTSIGA